MSDQHAKPGGVEDWKGEEFELQDESDYRVSTNLARSSGGDNRATPPGRKEDDNEENDDDETEIQTGNGEQSCGGNGSTDKIGTPGATNENEELTVDEGFGQSSGGELRLPELSEWRTPRNSVRWNISGESGEDSCLTRWRILTRQDDGIRGTSRGATRRQVVMRPRA